MKWIVPGTVLAGLILSFVPANAQVEFCAAHDYEGIPPSADFPVPHGVWVKWLGFDPNAPTVPGQFPDRPRDMNVAAIRRHIWKLWAEMTADSHSTRRDVVGPLPRWETWFEASDVLAVSAGVLPKNFAGAGLPRFEQPPQSQASQNPSPQQGLSQSVLYNRPVCNTVIDHQLGRDDVRACLKEMPNHSVPEFKDPTSIALKPIWMTVSSSPANCTSIPVWDGVPSDPKSLVNFPATWSAAVQVRADPRQKCSGETVDLDRFYHRRVVDMSQVRSGQPSSAGVLPAQLQILVGMQVMTKEIDPWVWATFWWHDRALAGDSVFAAGRDSVPINRNVWKNYLMDVAVDMDRPWQPDGRPKAAYNPYLEGQLIDGTRSNCMTCHARASWPAIPPRETLVSGGTKLDFIAIVVTGREASRVTYFPEADTELNLKFFWTLARAQATPRLLQDAPASAAKANPVAPSCPPQLKQQLR